MKNAGRRLGSSPTAKSWIRRSCTSFGFGCGFGFALVACGSTPAPSECPTGPGFDLVFVGSDYNSTQAGAVSLDGRMNVKGTVDLGGDPALSLSAGRAFLVARDTDTIFELDPKCGDGIGRFSAQDSPGMKTNPQDVVASSDGTLFVTRFNVPSILVVKDGVRSTIDLSALDTLDGNPEASGAVGVGTHAFAALGVLDRDAMFKSTRPSLMAVIDMPSRTIERTVTLAGRNPFGSLFVGNEGGIWLAEPGNFFSAIEKDAGLERFDPQTMTTKLVLPETMIGANVVEVVVDGTCAVAITADSSAKNRTNAVTIDLAQKRITRTLIVTDDFLLRGLTMSASSLVIGERTKIDAGYALHVFRRLGQGCAFQADHDVVVPAPPIAVRFTR